MSELSMPKRSVIKSGHKQAAMKLSGVAEADREWILSRLVPEQREIVQSAYAQLQVLQGSAALDFSLFFETPGVDLAHAYTDPMELSINGLAYDSVRQVLDELSLAYVIAFIRTDLWRGRRRYWSECSAERIASLEALEHRAKTPRGARALADAVASLVVSN
jgi:hypothetical protein